jgi:Carboxypeptidase regulatory-like domain
VVEKSKDLQLSDLVLKRSSRELVGLVTNADDKPVAEARVDLRGLVPMKTVTDAKGRFRLRALPDGILDLFVDALDYEIAYEAVSADKKELKIILQRE